jgi:uncharacterized protein
MYVDTSVLVSALTFELASPRVQLWLELQQPGSLQISLWVETELSSVLSKKVGNKELTPALRDFCLRGFATLKEESLTIAPIKQKHFVSAAKLLDASQLGLHAPDALHLAVSMDIGATLCTLDNDLAKAAEAVGVKVLKP